jgi:disulfide bond formation protein DsbB
MTAYLKAYAALVGAVATALLGLYAADTQLGRILTVVAAVATAVATYAVPNLDPKAQHQDESVQPPKPTGGAQMGYADPVYLLLIVVILIVVLVVVLPRLV